MMAAELEIPRGPVREYLIAFGIAAVYVAAPPIGAPCLIGHTRDLGRSLKAIRERWNIFAAITAAFWVASDEKAEAVARAATDALPVDGRRGGCDATGERGRKTIEAVAADLGVVLTCHDAAMSRVNAAVGYVTAELEAANASGRLKFFNTAYRQYRNSAKAAGGRVMAYGEAVARLRKALITRAARGGDAALSVDILSEIFPVLRR